MLRLASAPLARRLLARGAAAAAPTRPARPMIAVRGLAGKKEDKRDTKAAPVVNLDAEIAKVSGLCLECVLVLMIMTLLC